MSITYGFENSGARVTSPPGDSDLRPQKANPLDDASRYSLEQILRLDKAELIKLLWSTAPKIRRILQGGESVIEIRNRLFEYLNEQERHYFNIYSDKNFKDMHHVRKKHAKWCIRALKNIIRTENEKLCGASALSGLIKLASPDPARRERVSSGFICEILYLLLGIKGRFRFFTTGAQPELELTAEERPGLVRSRFLDGYGERVRSLMERFESGLDPANVSRCEEMKRRIMEFFGAEEADWNDHRWQLSNIIRKLEDLERLVELSEQERLALSLAEKHGIAFQITPYYLSLFESSADTGRDDVIRAQVLPSRSYVDGVIRTKEKGESLDFMGEASTSPVDGVTRRYVHVLILKAFNSCPQICVYCQRNWEITGLDQSCVTRDKMQQAIDWVAQNDNIQEVLVTGGDPLTPPDDYLAWILDRLAAIPHLERIRISTRTPVTMPMRITPELVALLRQYHDFGRREVCVVTHFESPLEMTPQALAAVRRIRDAGMNVYNQEVFTWYNSRRFQSAHLRRMLKKSGVDPYYCFNTKGKDETVDFRVPIARLLQEWAEEARLMPGLARTDTPVFNVPTLGKSYLQSWQDHEVVMILPDGRRVYRFYPWESMLSRTQPYLYTDVSIHAYLMRLLEAGEDLEEYRTIWYYF